MSKEGSAEDALFSGEQELRLLAETIPALVWRAGPDGNLEYANKRLLEYLGATPGEIIGSGWMERVHPADIAFKTKTWLRNIGFGTAHDAVCRFRGADGQYRWFLVIGSPLRAGDGSVCRWYGVLIDIDDRTKATEALQESEYKLLEIIETVPGLVWSTDPDGQLTHVNKRMLDYSDMRLEEVKRAGWEAFVHPDDLPEAASAFYHAIHTGAPYQGVVRLRRSDGEFRWHHARCAPLRDRDGRIVQWYGLSVDIDEGKRAEELLRRSEAYLAEAQYLSHSGSAAYDDRTILYWSGETYRIFELDPRCGLPSRETVLQMIHPDDRERVREEARQAVQERRDYKVEYRIVPASGTVKYIEVIAHPKFSVDGNLTEIVSTLIDVSERKHAEQALRESELKLRQVMDTVPGLTWSTGADASEGKTAEVRAGFMAQVQAILNVLPAYVWYAPPSGGLTFVNKRQADALGLPADHPLRFGIDTGAQWDAHIPFLHPDDQENGRNYWSNSLRTGEGYEHNYRVRTNSGDYRWFHTRTDPLKASDGSLLLWVGATLDIEELKRAEEGLRESEAKFRDYAESASDWFWEIDADYNLTSLTQNAFGANAAGRIGTSAWDHALDLETEPEKWRAFKATLDARKPFRDFVYRSGRRDSAPRDVKASGKPMFDAKGEFRGYRGTGTDVTALMRAQAEREKLRQLESDLAHMNRLSVMGELTASLAHEITQPVASARNNARAALNFLDKRPADLDEVREALHSIVGDADRAGDIIDRIRDQIRKAPPRKSHFDLNEAINVVTVLARSALTANGVSVETRLAEGLSPVEGDRVQLQQVVMNLIMNAVEAMSTTEARPRDLLIRSEQIRSTDILVSVCDSGPGIDPAHLDRVFEAFYTTKSSGVGMGLSVCRSIIEAHGGRLWADKVVPWGAVLRFTLPNAELELNPLSEPGPK